MKKKLLLSLIALFGIMGGAMANDYQPADGQFIKLHHANTSANWYVGMNELGTGFQAYATQATNATDIWKVEATGTDGQFYFYNPYCGKYLGKTGAVNDNAAIPMVNATGDAGKYQFIACESTINNKEYDAFYLRDVTNNNDSRNGLHSTSAVTFVRWESQNNCENSLWLPEVVDITAEQLEATLLNNYTTTRTTFLNKCQGHTENAGQMGYITTEAKALYDQYENTTPTVYDAAQFLALKAVQVNNIAVLPTLNSLYYVSNYHAYETTDHYLIVADDGSLSTQNEKNQKSLWKVVAVNQANGTIQLQSAYNPTKYLNQSGGTLQTYTSAATFICGTSMLWAQTVGCYNLVAQSNGNKYTASKNDNSTFEYFTDKVSDGSPWSTNWKFEEYSIAPVNVTYIFTENGDTEELNIELLEGSNAEDYIPAMNFCTVNGVTETNKTVSESNNTFHVDATWNLPFVAGHVYRLGVRASGGYSPKYCGYRNDGKPAARNNDDPDNFASFAPEALWVFERVDGKLNQYKLYNLGSKNYINGNGFNATGYIYTLEPRPSNVSMGDITEMGFALHGNNTYLSNAAGAISGYGNCELSHWNGMDAGSIFWVKDITSEISALTTMGDPESKFLGEAEYTVNATAKTTAAENPTRDNVNALFICNFADAVNTSKYYRLKCQATDRSNKYIYSDIHANTNGNVDDAAAEHRKVVSLSESPVVNTLFQFEKSNDAYYVIHVNSGKWFSAVSSSNSVVDLPFYKESAGTYEPTQVDGRWWGIKRSGTSIHVHQSNHNNGELIVWGAFNAEPASNWTIEEVEEIPVTIGAAGYSTFCAPMNVVIPSSVEAYIIKSTNAESATLTKVEGILPAETGVILKNAGTHNFTITNDAATADVDGNLLSGTTIRRQGFGENVNYVLANTNGIGLYLNGTVNAVPANKAYLPASAGISNGIKSFSFSFDEDPIETAIKTLEAEQMAKSTIYDLQGRRVEKAQKGLYIINGKKVMVK